MIDDFESLSKGNKKLKEGNLDGAMNYFHNILKKNKNHIKLYKTNFDLFCMNKINSKNFDFMRLVCEFYFEDNFVSHNLVFHNTLKLTKFNTLNDTLKNSNSKILNYRFCFNYILAN